MYLENNSQQEFKKNLVSTIFCIFLTIDGSQWNKANAAIVLNPDNISAPKEACNKTCQSFICMTEAYRFRSLLIDESIDPCDDFYRFTCGKFINDSSVQIDEMRSMGLSDSIQIMIDNQVFASINNIKLNDSEYTAKMYTFYQNCLNQNEGIDSILRIMKNIGGFPMLLGDTWNETAYSWKEALFKIIDEDIPIKFPVSIGTYELNSTSSKNTPVLIGVEINNIKFEKNNNERYREWLSLVTESVVALGANHEAVKAEIDDLLDFQIKLYNIISTDKEIADQKLEEVTVTVDTLAQNYPSIPWLELLNKMLNRHDIYIASSDITILDDKKFIDNLENLMNTTPTRVMANFLAWNVLATVYPYLPEPFHQLSQRYKVTQAKDRVYFCFMQLKSHFSLALDSLYVKKYLTSNYHEEMYKDVKNLVQNVKNEIEKTLESAEWLDNITKATALKKIRAMHSLIGYDRELVDNRAIDEYYSELEIISGSFIQSGINVENFKVSNRYKSLKLRSEKTSWRTRKSVINFNAHYIYLKNAIDVHDAFLQASMYTYGRPNFMNYGSFGSIIGHEIMHAFDNIGRNFDENGRWKWTWVNATEQKYLEKAQCIIDQFSNFIFPNINLTVNGERTINENIADNGGFAAAYRAYTKLIEQDGINEECLPNLNYTPKQMFWITCAANWCSKDGASFIKNWIESDEHPPNYPRVVLSFSNIKEFAEDFNCKVNSRMNPEKKCTIW